ncbi:hypothetical protein [Streptomyces dubilierae]|uniref:Secreted protein n=1 Tax=Streptomyces dubilierae TaxID=3075533 RepID=A0ABU2P6S6_9ACTN|nr:hypothetical protein [Streptomyces sp. DSM 41921]MDT0387853.1 hypothetical protein [Streptomyces sp. DSM 41921]
MDWGDIPAWLAFALSGGALWVSIKARGDGRKSADASATSAEASVRSAAAAEEALALQRQEAEARRAAEEEAARPRVDLRIEWVKGSKYRIVNYGDAAAANIRCLNTNGFSRGLTEPISLGRHTAHEFIMSGSMQEPKPPYLRLVWDGQEEPVHLLMP